MGIFNECQISLELGPAISFKAKKILRNQITENGGTISYIITKKLTHLVVSPDITDSYKTRTCEKYGVPIVPISFISSCTEAGKLLAIDKSQIDVVKQQKDFSQGCITAARLEAGVQKKKKSAAVSLHNVKVWLWGDTNAPHFPDHDYEIAKSITLLKQTTEKSMFCVMEIHVSNDPVSTIRVFCHRGILKQSKADVGEKESRFVTTADEALTIYSQLIHRWMEPPNSYAITDDMPNLQIGSDKFQQMSLERNIRMKPVDNNVANLLEHVWQEATGKLQHLLSVPLDTINVDKIEKAEAVLLELKTAVAAKQDDKVNSLTGEFYSHVTYKSEHKVRIDDLQHIAKQQVVCQLIKDVVSVSEATCWTKQTTVQAMYAALRCYVECLSRESVEYEDMKRRVMDADDGTNKISVVRIYKVHRAVENAEFRNCLCNKRYLFHASTVKNFVGILSRGLLLPKIVVDDFGGQRSDAGMLGNGIYFTDSSSTSAKYSTASHTKGTRMMLINEVALGACKDVYQFDLDLAAPPAGFDSVHGVRSSHDQQSQFKDDEYVVYSCSQQRLRYLVEFTIDGDAAKEIQHCLAHGMDDPVAEKRRSIAKGDIQTDAVALETLVSDVCGQPDPLLSVKAGLVSSRSTAAVPLTAVHVRAKLLDLSAQVVVLQEYWNASDSSIEARYVFPLSDLGVVVGFEAFIAGRHVIGEVKEKEAARKEYREAMSAGHGAYLMEQDEQMPDVFAVSVGNIPARTSVLVKITYVTELTAEGDDVLFSLPASVAPWKRATAMADITQTSVETIETDREKEVTVQVAIEMPFEIRSIECPTHDIKKKVTSTKAVVELERLQALGDGFRLLVKLAEIHRPRMWVEQHPTLQHSQACMLTFYPEFEASPKCDFEMIFMVDVSNSMAGRPLEEARKLLLLALHYLPDACSFNIVPFGTEYKELFPVSQPKTWSNIRLAIPFIQNLAADRGNTELYPALRSFYLLRPLVAGQRNILLISDGHFNNEAAILRTATQNALNTRVFTCGSSSTVNHHSLRSLARAAAGAYEFFDPSGKRKWAGKMRSQLRKAGQPALTDIAVTWQRFSDGGDGGGGSTPPPTQAPSRITALFSGCRQVVYGFVDNCTQATLTAMIGNKEMSTVVSTPDLNITKGKVLHQLAARAVIRDWEEGSLADNRADHETLRKTRKNEIVRLSIQHSIVTQFTSFVAIETRQDGQVEVQKEGPSMAELVTSEDVDILSYISWEKFERVILSDHFAKKVVSTSESAPQQRALAPVLPPAPPLVPRLATQQQQQQLVRKKKKPVSQTTDEASADQMQSVKNELPQRGGAAGGAVTGAAPRRWHGNAAPTELGGAGPPPATATVDTATGDLEGPWSVSRGACRMAPLSTRPTRAKQMQKRLSSVVASAAPFGAGQRQEMSSMAAPLMAKEMSAALSFVAGRTPAPVTASLDFGMAQPLMDTAPMAQRHIQTPAPVNASLGFGMAQPLMDTAPMAQRHIQTPAPVTASLGFGMAQPLMDTAPMAQRHIQTPAPVTASLGFGMAQPLMDTAPMAQRHIQTPAPVTAFVGFGMAKPLMDTAPMALHDMSSGALCAEQEMSSVAAPPPAPTELAVTKATHPTVMMQQHDDAAEFSQERSCLVGSLRRVQANTSRRHPDYMSATMLREADMEQYSCVQELRGELQEAHPVVSPRLGSSNDRFEAMTEMTQSVSHFPTQKTAMSAEWHTTPKAKLAKRRRAVRYGREASQLGSSRDGPVVQRGGGGGMAEDDDEEAEEKMEETEESTEDESMTSYFSPGSDESSSCSEGKPLASAEDMDRIFTVLALLQSPEGYIESSPELDNLLDISGSACKKMLLEAGLRSLGDRVNRDVTRLLYTLVVFLRILGRLCRPLPSPERTNGWVHLLDDYFLHLLSLAQFHLLKMAAGYCTRTVASHPLLCSCLQLGRSWHHVVVSQILA